MMTRPPGYWDYPTQSNTMPLRMLPPGPFVPQYPGIPTPPGPTAANYSDENQNVLDPIYLVTPVGAYIWSPGPYGTFDQGGNVNEWVDYPGTAWKGCSGGLMGYPGSWLYAHNQPTVPDTPPDWYWTTGTGFRLGARLEPFQKDRPQVPPLPPPSPDQKKLIVFTHGRSTSSEDWVELSNPNAQGNKWRDLYRALANSPYTQGWTIWPWDWTSKSDAPVSRVLSIAEEEGEKLGKEIIQGHYDLVHLIGFSAGSALIAKASEVIKLNSPNTIIHTTFLDPFSGLEDLWLDYWSGYETWTLKYGYFSDWSDNYVTKGDYPLTAPKLPYAHNVDLTGLGDIGFGPPAHDYAVRFYTQTIFNPTNPLFEKYGFARTMEYEGWNSNGNYSLGNEWVKLHANNKIKWKKTFDLSPLVCETSPTGTVECGLGWIQMTTGSPVWVVAEIPIDQPVNLLSVDLEFTSLPGAEGLLAIYWDDQVIGLFDERLVDPGRQTYILDLPETVWEDDHYLELRLDPYTDVPSRVLVDNIRLGYWEVVEAVPEPPTWLGVLLGLGFLLGARRWWRRQSVPARNRPPIGSTPSVPGGTSYIWGRTPLHPTPYRSGLGEAVESPY